MDKDPPRHAHINTTASAYRSGSVGGVKLNKQLGSSLTWLTFSVRRPFKSDYARPRETYSTKKKERKKNIKDTKIIYNPRCVNNTCINRKRPRECFVRCSVMSHTFTPTANTAVLLSHRTPFNRKDTFSSWHVQENEEHKSPWVFGLRHHKAVKTHLSEYSYCFVNVRVYWTYWMKRNRSENRTVNLTEMCTALS